MIRLKWKIEDEDVLPELEPLHCLRLLLQD